LMMMIVIDVMAMMIHPIKPRRLESRHEATVPCSDKYSLTDECICTKAWDKPKRYSTLYVQAALEDAQYVQKIINKKIVRFPSQNSDLVLPSQESRLQVVFNGRHGLNRMECPRRVLADELHVADVFGQILTSVCRELPLCACQTQTLRATDLDQPGSKLDECFVQWHQLIRAQVARTNILEALLVSRKVRGRFAADPARERWDEVPLCQTEGKQGERWRRLEQLLDEAVPSAVVKSVSLAQNASHGGNHL
jgi:hypothetical protein